jgi:DNA polymerase-3 subunit gamma/tau
VVVPAVAAEKKTLKPVIPAKESTSPISNSPLLQRGGGGDLNPPSSPFSKGEIKDLPDPTGLTLNDVERVWPQVIELVKAKRMSLSLYLAEAEPAEVEGLVIVLGLPSEFRFHKETLEKELNKQVIEDAFAQVLGKKVRVQCVVTERDGATQDADEERAPATQDEGVSDIVNKALEIFDGSKVIRKD